MTGTLYRLIECVVLWEDKGELQVGEKGHFYLLIDAQLAKQLRLAAVVELYIIVNKGRSNITFPRISARVMMEVCMGLLLG